MVSNGQLANQTTFNTAFVSRTVDTSTVGKLDLSNAATESGTSIVNSQREFNALSSYTGKALNVAKDTIPAWTNNDVGASGNNLFQRGDALTAEFNSSTGHTHSGAPGEAPPINLATSVNGFLPLTNAGLGTNDFDQQAIIYLSGSTFVSASGFFNASGTQFGMYTDAPSAGFDLNSTLGIRQDNDATTGNITALPFDTSLVRLSNSPTIHGISSTGVENSFLYLMNASSGSIVLSNESASANMADRIVTGTSADTSLAAGAMTLAAYDKTSTRWRLFEKGAKIDHTHTGAGGEGPQINLTNAVTGLLPVANAGLGNGTFDQNAIIYLNGSNFTSGSGFFAASGTQFGMYTQSASAGFDLNSTLGIRQEASAASGDVTALTFTKSLVRFSNSPTIHGIDSTGVENTFLYLMNGSASDITIPNDSASASIENRIITGTGDSFTFEPGGMALVAYDTTSDRWRLMGGGSSGASATIPDASYEMSNLALSVSVASNIITVALKTKTGADPSVGSPVIIGFRDATATSGTYNQRSVTAANSLTLGTAVSLGAKTAVANEFIIYAFDDAGTVTLGASLLQLDERSLQSSSTTGTSNAVIYQSSALSSKPIRVIGRFAATWTNAVGWSAITEVCAGIIPYRKIKFSGYFAGAQTVAQNTTTTVIIDTIRKDTHNCFNTSTGVFTAPKAMELRASGKVMYTSDSLAGQRYITILAKNTTGEVIAVFDHLAVTGTGMMGGGGSTGFTLAAGDTLVLRTQTSHVATNTINTGIDSTFLDLEEI